MEKLEGAHMILYSSFWSDHSPPDSLICSPGLQSHERMNFCCFKPPACGNLLQETATPPPYYFCIHFAFSPPTG